VKWQYNPDPWDIDAEEIEMFNILFGGAAAGGGI
jgi:hypothetical protein